MIRVPRPVRALGATALALAVLIVPSSPALADSIRDREWHLTDLHIDEAHRITDGTGVTVALIDTGVDAEHPDLQGAILSGTQVGFDVNGGVGADGREDIAGHGTAMAGLIAGRGHGNGDGILGIAPGAKILPIFAPIAASQSSDYMIEAVDFAIAHHASVINMSFGAKDTDILREAMRKALAANIVLVSASGNNNESQSLFPGKYDQVLTVGAYGQDGKLASFSTKGAQVDIVAPGVDILTTNIKQAYPYVTEQGTSASSAIVSGAVALLRAKYPDLSATEIVHRLTATATDAGPPGRDDGYGYGRLDIVKALTADVPPLPDTSGSATSGSATSGSTAPAPAGTAAATSTVKPSAVAQTSNSRTLAAIIAVAFAAGATLLLGLIVVVIVLLRRRRTQW